MNFIIWYFSTNQTIYTQWYIPQTKPRIVYKIPFSKTDSYMKRIASKLVPSIFFYSSLKSWNNYTVDMISNKNFILFWLHLFFSLACDEGKSDCDSNIWFNIIKIKYHFYLNSYRFYFRIFFSFRSRSIIWILKLTQPNI